MDRVDVLVGTPYAVLAPAMLVEGPVATFVGGTLVGAGHAALLLVWVLAFGIDLVLDSGLYLLGRAGRRAGRHPWVARASTRLGFTPGRQETLCRKASDHLGTVVAGAKLVDVGAIPAFLAAGYAAVGYRRFLGWTALLTAVRVSVLTALGMATGEHLAARVEGVLDRPWLAVLAGLSIAALVAGVKAVVGAALRTIRSGGGLLAASFQEA